MADKFFETIKTVVSQVNLVLQCATSHQTTFNWLSTCNLIMCWKLKVSLKRSHSEGLEDFEGIILQFKMISNKVPRYGNICVYGKNTYFQIMEDGKCLSEIWKPSCSTNSRISTWHVLVVYITFFSSIPDKWYWWWLVWESLLQEQTYLLLYSFWVRLFENTMQNKVMHIRVIFPTIKCLTINFLHYTYYHFTHTVHHLSSKLENKQYHTKWKWHTQ